MASLILRRHQEPDPARRATLQHQISTYARSVENDRLRKDLDWRQKLCDALEASQPAPSRLDTVITRLQAMVEHVFNPPLPDEIELLDPPDRSTL